MKRFLLFPLASIVALATLAAPAHAATVRKASVSANTTIAPFSDAYSASFKASNGAVNIQTNFDAYVGPVPCQDIPLAIPFLVVHPCSDYTIYLQQQVGSKWVDILSTTFTAQGNTDSVTWDGGVGTTATYRVRFHNNFTMPNTRIAGHYSVNTTVDPDGNHR